MTELLQQDDHNSAPQVPLSSEGKGGGLLINSENKRTVLMSSLRGSSVAAIKSQVKTLIRENAVTASDDDTFPIITKLHHRSSDDAKSEAGILSTTTMMMDDSSASFFSGSSYYSTGGGRPSQYGSQQTLPSLVPESSKLQGRRRLSLEEAASRRIPLNIKIKQLGLFGRDKEIDTIQQCVTQQWEGAAAQHKAKAVAEATTTEGAGAPNQQPDNKKEKSEDQQNNKNHDEKQRRKKARKAKGTGTTKAPTSPNQPDGNNSGKEENDKKEEHKKVLLRNLIWIAGEGGTGKSSLVEQALLKSKSSSDDSDGLVNQFGGFLVRGKCDSQSKGGDHRRPFEALAMACDDLCVQILASKGDPSMFPRYRRFEDSFKKAGDGAMSNDEAFLLKRLIPGLEPIIQIILMANQQQRQKQEAEAGNDIVTEDDSKAVANDAGSGGRRYPDYYNQHQKEEQQEPQTTPSSELQQHTVNSSSLSSQLPSSEARHQFHFVFSKFIKLVANAFPLAIMIDDLQWSDNGTIDILEKLATDTDSAMNNVVLIGSYRDDEVTQSNKLSELLQNTLIDNGNNSNKQQDLKVTKIELNALNVHDLNPLLAELLELEQDQTLSLTEVCCKKTGGNPFFFIQFVKTLWKDQRIKYDHVMTNQYQWDLVDIEGNSNVADNVVVFLTNRLVTLPPRARQLLLLASCLGVEFDVETLGSVLCDLHDPNNDVDATTKSEPSASSAPSYMEDLQLCVEEGVIEMVPVRRRACSFVDSIRQQKDVDSRILYRWVHDRIVEAAQGLIGIVELPKLKVCIGEILLKSFNDDRLEDELFVVVNLLNEGEPSRARKPIQLAELNLRAAKKAASLSSFDGAAFYCRRGIEVLSSACATSGDSKWTDHYRLALSLHSTGADMLSVLGDHEGSKRECHEVLSRDFIPILDKIYPHEVLMDSIFCQSKPCEASKMGFDILTQQLGVPLPKNKIWATLQLINGIKKHTSNADKICSQLRTLQLNDGTLENAASRYLITICKYSALTGSPLLVVAPMKLISYSIEKGLLADTALSVAVVGMVVSEFGGDIKAGAKYATLALELADKAQSKRRTPEVIMYSNAFVLHHTKPIHMLLKPTLKAYNLCLQVGNVDHASYSISAYLILAYRSGKALRAIEADLRVYAKQIHQLQVAFADVQVGLLWQVVMNLMEFPETEPTVLTGEAMDEESFHSATKEDLINKGLYHAYRSQLFAIFSHHKQSAKLSIARKGLTLTIPGNAFAVMDVCYRALSVFAVARASKKLKYKRHAKKLKAIIEKWANAGDPNVVHFKCLLDAEMAALKGRTEEAEQHYSTAVSMAARHGFVQDAALFNERFADFYQVELGDLSSAAFRYQEALRIYDEWGAQSKVTALTAATLELLSNLSCGSFASSLAASSLGGSSRY